jgi:integrase
VLFERIGLEGIFERLSNGRSDRSFLYQEPTMPQWIGKWIGGRVKLDRHGRTVWVIERKIGSEKITVTLRNMPSEDHAKNEFFEFEKNPVEYLKAYRQKKQATVEEIARADSMVLTPELIAEVVKHVKASGSSEDYANYTVEAYLSEWAAELKGVDLRDLPTTRLKAILKGWDTAEHKRVVALKVLSSYLREEKGLRRSEDPTLDIKVPPVPGGRPADQRAYSPAHVEAFYAALTNWKYANGYFGDKHPDGVELATVDLQAVRDVFLLRVKTGMHGEEISRLAAGDGVVRVLEDYGEIAGTLFFEHKRKEDFIVSVDKQTLAAAQRLKAAGEVPNRVKMSREMRRVSKLNPKLKPIQVSNLRHTFATWCGYLARLVKPKDAGIPLEVIAQLMNHASVKTTKKHYLGIYVPPMAAFPVKFENKDDPPLS